MALENTLQGFIAKVRDNGLAVSSHYYVTISDPSDMSDITLLIDNVSMPGLTILSQEMRTFGEIVEMPYGVGYNPVTISVIVTNRAEAIEYFHKWTNAIYDRETRYSSFAEDYLREVRIVLQDRNHDDIYTLILEDAYPKTIGDISLDYANHDVVKISVTLQYSRWRVDSAKIDFSEYGKFTPDTGALLQELSLLNLNDRRQALYEWGQPSGIGTGLQQYGGAMGASIGRASSAVQAQLRGKTLIGNGSSDQSGGLSSALGNLTSNFVKMGEGFRDLGRNLNDVVAPVRAISGAVSSVSGTLGSIDSTLNAMGLGTPFSKIRGNLNSTAGALYNVGLLKGVPGHIGSIGANMTGMGKTFNNVSEAMKKSTNATTGITDSLNKLGNVFTRQGSNTVNGSGNLQSYSDNNP